MKACQIARGGLFTGVSVAMLCMASLLQVMSWAMCMLVGFIPAIFLLRHDAKTGAMVYIATSVLSMIIVPDKSIAILYTLFFGLYTVLKYRFESMKSRFTDFICKYCYVNLLLVLLYYIIRIGFLVEISQYNVPIPLLIFMGGNLFFLYYDFCLSKILAGIAKILTRFK